MKILLPKSITSNLSNIQAVTLNVNNYSVPLTPETLALGIVGLHDDEFDKATNLSFDVKLITGETNSIINHKINFIEKRDQIKINFVDDVNIRINTKSPFQNTELNRQMVIDSVATMYEDVDNIGSSQRGYKNLIYFTVFGQGYTDLLKLCLDSIDITTPVKNFDVLIIADIGSQKLINNTCNLDNFNVHFMTVDTPADGIDSSKNKVKIFNWNNINEYNKILFLDCDVIGVKGVNTIFDREYEPHKLYTVYNPTIATHVVDSAYHSVTRATQAQKNIYTTFNQRPFNAGQFLFINTDKMNQHFNNVMWFMENWPGEYFFEQSFMVEYFCRNVLTVCDVIQSDIMISLIDLNNAPEKVHTDNTLLIHFAGPALNYIVKKDFIDSYLNAYLSQ